MAIRKKKSVYELIGQRLGAKLKLDFDSIEVPYHDGGTYSKNRYIESQKQAFINKENKARGRALKLNFSYNSAYKKQDRRAREFAERQKEKRHAQIEKAFEKEMGKHSKRELSKLLRNNPAIKKEQADRFIAMGYGSIG